MSIAFRAEASRAVVVLDGVDRVAFNEDGSMELLTPAANPAGNQLVTAANVVGYNSGAQTIPAAGGLLTLSHGLGAVPGDVNLEYVCKVAGDGYSIGDVVDFSYVAYIHTSATTTGFNITKTDTQLIIRVGSGGPAFLTVKSTGAAIALANVTANFNLIVRARP